MSRSRTDLQTSRSSSPRRTLRVLRLHAHGRSPIARPFVTPTSWGDDPGRARRTPGTQGRRSPHPNHPPATRYACWATPPLPSKAHPTRQSSNGWPRLPRRSSTNSPSAIKPRRTSHPHPRQTGAAVVASFPLKGTREDARGPRGSGRSGEPNASRLPIAARAATLEPHPLARAQACQRRERKLRLPEDRAGEASVSRALRSHRRKRGRR
jgi:hypothetical protein